MIPPSADTAAPAGPPPVELTDRELGQLRRSASWARFIAIVGIVLTIVIALGCLTVIIMDRKGSGLWNAASLVPITVSVTGFGGAAVLVLGYGRRLRSFLRHGEPSLAQAFRQLRIFFKLWTVVVALNIAMDVLALFGKL
jgi:hypothetical protein